MNLNCWRCTGVGYTPRRLVDCSALDKGELFCLDHWQHYAFDRWCWLCLGSGKADMFTLLWRWVMSPAKGAGPIERMK